MRLRTQLTLVVTAVVALVVALAGLLIVLRIDHRDRSDLDELLALRAEQVTAAATRSGSLPTDGSYAVRLLQGDKVAKQVGATETFPMPAADGYATVRTAGSDWRTLTQSLATGARMQILISLRDLEEQHDDNVLVVDLLVLFAALLTAAGVWFATGLVLRPFQRLLTAARALDPADPEARLPEVTSPREVAELTGTLNGMLARFRAKAVEAPRPDAPASSAAPSAAATNAAVTSPTVQLPVTTPKPAAPTPTPPPAAPAPAPAPAAQAPAPAAQAPAAPGPAPGAPAPAPAAPVPAPAEAKPEPIDPGPVLSPALADLGANLDMLLDNPDLPAGQRHLILATMAEDHRQMVALLDELRRR